LSTEEKVVLVLKYAKEFGLNQTLKALGLSKSTWHYRCCRTVPYTQKHSFLRNPLMKIARRHPHYGYRKVTDELRDQGFVVNHKVVQKLQKAWELPLLRAVRHPRPSGIRRAIAAMGARVDLTRHLHDIEPLQLMYTDFTELIFDRGDQTALFMPIIDHISKWAVGWSVGAAANTRLALAAWERAKRRLLRYGISLNKVVIHQDQDGVYTSHEWLRILRLRDGVRVSYSLDGARGNTAMESFNGHFKEENAAILWEQRDLISVIRVVESRMLYYNDIRRHASLGNISPLVFLKKHGLEPRQGASVN
jgi:putative transposase